MILVDSSIWIDHLRANDQALSTALNAGAVLIHPFVIGELALGSLRDRATVIALLKNLPSAQIADHEEVLTLVERHRLFSRGLGYVDAALLASTLLTSGAMLWTRDRCLNDVAKALGCAK